MDTNVYKYRAKDSLRAKAGNDEMQFIASLAEAVRRDDYSNRKDRSLWAVKDMSVTATLYLLSFNFLEIDHKSVGKSMKSLTWRKMPHVAGGE